MRFKKGDKVKVYGWVFDYTGDMLKYMHGDAAKVKGVVSEGSELTLKFSKNERNPWLDSLSCSAHPKQCRKVNK